MYVPEHVVKREGEDMTMRCVVANCFLLFCLLPLRAMDKPWLAERWQSFSEKKLPNDRSILLRNFYWQELQTKSVGEKNDALHAVVLWDVPWEKKRYHVVGAIAAGANPNCAIPDTRKLLLNTKCYEPVLAYPYDCLLSLAIRNDDRELYEYLLVHGSRRTPSADLLAPLAEAMAQAVAHPKGNGAMFLEDLLKNGDASNQQLWVAWFGSKVAVPPLFLAKTRVLAELLVQYGSDKRRRICVQDCTWTLPHVFALCDDCEPALFAWCSAERIPLHVADERGKTPLRMLIEKLEYRPPERLVSCFCCTRERSAQTEQIEQKITILAHARGLPEEDRLRLQEILQKKSACIKNKRGQDMRDRGACMCAGGGLAGCFTCFHECMRNGIISNAVSSCPEVVLAEAVVASLLCLAGGVECACQWEQPRYDCLQQLLQEQSAQSEAESEGPEADSKVPMQKCMVYRPVPIRASAPVPLPKNCLPREALSTVCSVREQPCDQQLSQLSVQ